MSTLSNKKIAITGTIGSGKSSLTNIISEYYPTISSDEIVDKLYQDSALIKLVNKEVLNVDSKVIDKKILSAVIFSNPKLKVKLERIIHPLVKDKIIEFFNLHEGLIFVEVPLLFEAKFDYLFDEIILVKTKEEIIIERLMKNRNYSKDEARNRIKQQYPIFVKEFKSDYVIENNQSLEKLKSSAIELLKVIEGSD